MTTPQPSRLSRVVRRLATNLRQGYGWPAGLKLFVVLCLPFSGALAQAARFDIPAQPGSSALQVFIKQSGREVIYPFDDLRKVTTNAVTGDLEPAFALEQLLAQTGFVARQSKPSQFIVAAITAAKPGAIEGEVREEKSGKPVMGAKVQLAGSGNSVLTDKRGRFVIEDVAAGSQVLLIAAEGMQNTRVTDVEVNAGHRLSLSPIGIPVKQEGPLQLDPYSVSAKKNDGTLELDPYSVEGRKEKPFVAGNVDIPRTINDVQPYYVFDNKTIDQSGAVNIEQFLKQRLMMNTSALSNNQDPQTSATGNRGNASEVNLRGLGADKTLILVNGRRQAGVVIGDQQYQTDINGIPPSAVERIEVLPSSASGIYGGSAIGGVINIILKKDYSGGEIRTTYDNTFNSDSPVRSVSLTEGFSANRGNTHILFSASWSDASPLLLGDRQDIFKKNLATITRNSPDYLVSSGFAFPGDTPNILASSPSDNLVLKSGQALASNKTFISEGTPPTISSADLGAMLLVNAGKWNTELPLSTQQPFGLLRPFGVTPETKSLTFNVRHQLTKAIELFADLAYNSTKSSYVQNPFGVNSTLAASNPTNPFTTSIRVAFPSNYSPVATYKSRTRSFTVGANAELPFGWIGEADYTFSDVTMDAHTYSFDFTEYSRARNAGEINYFVDTLLYPLDLAKYRREFFNSGDSQLQDITLRGSGKLPALPWGAPVLTIGLSDIIATAPPQSSREIYATDTSKNNQYDYYARKQETASAYSEINVPVLKEDIAPGVHALDLQASGRIDYYSVSAGTPYKLTTSSGVSYGDPMLDGQPYFTKVRYSAHNYTVGFKYQPTPDVTLRISEATAFAPPSPQSLIPNPTYSTTEVTDPRNPSTGLQTVQLITGGNPDLKPENSKSLNAGLIYEPQASLLRGLRINVEYYRIRQFDAIVFLDAQSYVGLENLYPDRVTRDSSGLITSVNASPVNLYKKETEGYDLSIGYRLETNVGTFALNAGQSIVKHLKTQYAQDQPDYEAAGYHPTEEGAPKHKGAATFTWERSTWSAGWSVRWISEYKQYGAAGGPSSIQYAGGGEYSPEVYITPQGGDTVAAQNYHDVFFGYAVPQRGIKDVQRNWRDVLMSGVSLQVGVRNVFNSAPPLDLGYSGTYFSSPYGDMRLRSYWVSLRKQF